ncbi:MAG TPA: Ig-like domain repeat protein, partial [Stellaceae bacterium]|nr:Ig-like domain repeat protein [Stellaceae bacterium]
MTVVGRAVRRAWAAFSIAKLAVDQAPRRGALAASLAALLVVTFIGGPALAASAPLLIKSFGTASIPVGGTTSLSFTVANTNAAAALTGIGFTDSFPPGLAISTPNGLSTSCGGTVTAVAGTGSLSLLGATLATSSSCTIQVNVTPSVAANMTNTTGQITSNESGPGGTATAFLTVTTPTAPTLIKSFGAASIPVGGTTSLSFTVANTNAAAALSGIGFTDSFPPGLAVSTPNGLSTSCGGTVTAVAGTGSLSLSGAPLAASSSCTIQVNVTPSAAAVMTNTTGAITANGSGPGGTASATLTVNKDATTTALVSSANPSVFGQPVTFTATVSPVAPGSGTPTGTVTFFTDGFPNIVSVNGSGQATLTTSNFGVGSHFVYAIYSGDGNFNSSTVNLPGNNQVVNQDATTTAVGASPNPSTPGQAVTFTATVTANAPGAGTPTGSVTFVFDGGVLTATPTLVGGVGTFTTSSLSTGTHTVVATYNGDTNFLTSSGTLSGGQIVNQIATSTALTPSANPSTLGSPVTFTATVTPTSGGPPTGSVTFTDVTTATTLGTQTLNGAGQATFTTSSLGLGPHTIAAAYSGDSTFSPSTGTLTQNVNPGVTPSTTTLGTSINPSLSGQPVTFTANV